jgi:hypothetical protein
MVDSDDLYGLMEVDDDLSTALGTETLADRDMVPPGFPWLPLASLGFDNAPGFSADIPTYRDFRAPEVPEGRAQCHLALWTKGVQDLGQWDRIPNA